MRASVDYYEGLLAVARGERNVMHAEKQTAYNERNQLVAALSRMWPSHLADHPSDDASWDDEWRTIVCIHSPAGQLTWHIRASERPLFAHLSEGENHWDGHTTETKYKRVAAIWESL